MRKASLLIVMFTFAQAMGADKVAPAPSPSPADGAEASYSPCRVVTKTTRSQVGADCAAGEVMTGIEKITPLTLHCSQMEMRCEAPTRFLSSEPLKVDAPTPAAAAAAALPVGTPAPERQIELLPPPPEEADKD